MIVSKVLLKTIVVLSVLIILTSSLYDSFAQQIIEDDEIDFSYLYRENDLQACEGATLLEGGIVPNVQCSSTIGLILLPIPYLCIYVGLNGLMYRCSFSTCLTWTLWICLGNGLGWCFGFINY